MNVKKNKSVPQQMKPSVQCNCMKLKQKQNPMDELKMMIILDLSTSKKNNKHITILLQKAHPNGGSWM